MFPLQIVTQAAKDTSLAWRGDPETLSNDKFTNASDLVLLGKMFKPLAPSQFEFLKDLLGAHSNGHTAEFLLKNSLWLS